MRPVGDFAKSTGKTFRRTQIQEAALGRPGFWFGYSQSNRLNCASLCGGIRHPGMALSPFWCAGLADSSIRRARVLRFSRKYNLAGTPDFLSSRRPCAFSFRLAVSCSRRVNPVSLSHSAWVLHHHIFRSVVLMVQYQHWLEEKNCGGATADARENAVIGYGVLKR